GHARAYVLDLRLQPCPVGVPGELYLGGHGVARGYVGQPEQTADAFRPDPFSEPNGTMYRTGDLARPLRDGTIEFLGRTDGQLKIRGYRIEPGEIEGALRRHPAIREAAVAAHESDGRDAVLVGYVVASGHPT